MTANKMVLFVCVGNAGRSLMAEAIFNSLAPEGWRAISAGVSPARSPNPLTGEVLAEIGVPLPPHAPQPLTEEMARSATVRISMSAFTHPACPRWFNPRMARSWEVLDTYHADGDAFRSIRDELRSRVESLIGELTASDTHRT